MCWRKQLPKSNIRTTCSSGWAGDGGEPAPVNHEKARTREIDRSPACGDSAHAPQGFLLLSESNYRCWASRPAPAHSLPQVVPTLTAAYDCDLISRVLFLRSPLRVLDRLSVRVGRIKSGRRIWSPAQREKTRPTSICANMASPLLREITAPRDVVEISI
jgi:hypothetical protein